MIESERNIFLYFTINIINYLEKPELNKNLVTLLLFSMPKAKRKMRETVMAENIETKTPNPKVRAKPLISGVPSQNKMIEVMILEVFESRTEVQARENPA